MADSPAPFHPVAHHLQVFINLANEIERELVRHLGINLTDYRALTALAAAGPITVGALAERIAASAATTTAILNRLELAGYVQRDRTPADRRRVLVSATPDVSTRIMALMGPLMHRTNDEIATLRAEDQAVVESFFGRAIGLLHDHLDDLRATTTTSDGIPSRRE